MEIRREMEEVCLKKALKPSGVLPETMPREKRDVSSLMLQS